uniref:Uncharacterized protein n=1 Tax=Anguilla anguilla TaxID=7936 RepID=A0A0E9SS99_ANGAN
MHEISTQTKGRLIQDQLSWKRGPCD